MFCSKCETAVAVAKGELSPTFHDCEPDAELSTIGCGFPGCNDDAVKIVAVHERQGYAMEAFTAINEYRCETHGRR